MSFPNSAFFGLFFLLPLCLAAQSAADTKSTQWATATRYGQVFGGTNIEPLETGSRLTHNFYIEGDIEARFNENWSALFVFGADFLQNRRDPEALAEGFLSDDPEFIAHPYTSHLRSIFLRLGGQYNYRIGQGDLSFSLSAGPAFSRYSRIYDQLQRAQNSRFVSGVLVDQSRATFNFMGSMRTQYVHWFARRFSLGCGLQLRYWRYLAGGMDTPGGIRYELSYAESAALDVRYDNNYDITSRTPDPATRGFELGWFINITQRL